MHGTPHVDSSLPQLVGQIVRSIHADDRTHHLDSTFLPNRERTVQILELLRRIIFPGFFDEQRLTSNTIHYHIGELLSRLRNILYEQVREALRYDLNLEAEGKGDASEHCDQQAHQVTEAFLARIPELRRLLSLDVQASFDGDPAARNTDEIIFCYPGLDAVFIYRMAHELYTLNVPLLPRIMSEYAHNETGIDIHPGADIGESFFIDHGTGVVIGETTIIGKRVRIYQGVTLGALSTKGGQVWRGRKRHPTIEDDVTIYPNATILGGDTTVGAGSTINGSVFLIQSVPPHHTVSIKHPQPEMRGKPGRRADKMGDTPETLVPTDFQI